MRYATCILLCLLFSSCTGFRKGDHEMKTPPDFFMYGGDSYDKELDVVRACWAKETVYSEGGKEILIVELAPSIATGPLFRGKKATIVGLASRSTLYRVNEFGPNPVAMAVLWNVKPTKSGTYKPVSSVGLVTLWKSEFNIVKAKPST
jgi:hypothetical protein